jgi:hypothetical protein
VIDSLIIARFHPPSGAVFAFGRAESGKTAGVSLLCATFFIFAAGMEPAIVRVEIAPERDERKVKDHGSSIYPPSGTRIHQFAA